MATLKISDLSVGDWVRYSGRDYQVKSIHGDFERVTLIGNKEQREESIYAIHPIPITAEILLKNGWENLRSGYKCSCGVYDIHIWIKEASVIVTIYELERILKAARMQVYSLDMSVHQLQHILRLAGVDKEINL